MKTLVWLLLFTLSSLAFAQFDQCEDFVYHSPEIQTHEEAASHCKGVHSFECVEFVFGDPASSLTKAQAADTCQHVELMSCVRTVYQRSEIESRSEAVLACRDIYTMDCVDFVNEDRNLTYLEAVAACQHVKSMDCVNRVYLDPDISREQAAQACREY